jgi:hypothetical protein
VINENSNQDPNELGDMGYCRNEERSELVVAVNEIDVDPTVMVRIANVVTSGITVSIVGDGSSGNDYRCCN